MSTNIKSIRVYLPATEDREELDVTARLDVEGGLGETVGFDGIAAEYDERLNQPWSLMGESTGYNPYPDGATISDHLGYKIAEEVLAYIEEHDGPMTRIEAFEPNGFAIVFVEDGGINLDFVSYDDHDQVRLEAITSALGLTLEVELLDESELGTEPENPKAPARVEGKIVRADGTSTEFSIGAGGTYQQWGGTVAELGESVDLVQTMANAAVNDDLLPRD